MKYQHAKTHAKQLEKGFRATLLQFVIDNLKTANMVPGMVNILATFRESKEIEVLLDDYNNEKRWDVITTLYTQAIKTDSECQVWEELIKKLWQTSERKLYHYHTHIVKLQILFRKFEEPTLQDIQRIQALFYNVSKESILEAAFSCFEDKPIFLAEFILTLGFKQEVLQKYSDDLLFLAHMLMTYNYDQQSWQIFSLVTFGSLKKSFPYLDTFFKCDAKQTIHYLKLNFGVQKWDVLLKALLFIRIVSKYDVFPSWISQQPLNVQLLGYSYKAALTGNEIDLSRVEISFRKHHTKVSLLCSLCILTMISIGHKQSGRLEKNHWQETLLLLLKRFKNCDDTIEILENCDDEMISGFRKIIPKVNQYMREIAHLFPDSSSAFWFCIAVASPALKTMLQPEMKKWVTMQLKHMMRLSQEQKEIIEAMNHKIFNFLLHKPLCSPQVEDIIAMVLFSLLDDSKRSSDNKDICDRLKLMIPWDCLLKEKHFALLNPHLNLSNRKAWYPCLFEKLGESINIDKITRGSIEFTAMHNPSQAFEIWQKFS